MKNLSREQLLEKLNDLYIELEQYEDLEKDYTDLEYDMEHLEKEFSELQERYNDLKWDYKELVDKYKDDEFLIDVLKSRVEELEDELFSRDK